MENVRQDAVANLGIQEFVNSGSILRKDADGKNCVNICMLSIK
jgi:hypothetical protein